jgi:hypothetical protein
MGKVESFSHPPYRPRGAASTVRRHGYCRWLDVGAEKATLQVMLDVELF